MQGVIFIAQEKLLFIELVFGVDDPLSSRLTQLGQRCVGLPCGRSTSNVQAWIDNGPQLC